MKSGRNQEALELLVDALGDRHLAAHVLVELLETVVPSPYPR